MGWNGEDTRTGHRCVRCRSPGLSHTAIGRSQRRSGRGAGPLGRSTECRGGQKPDGAVAGGSKSLASRFY